MAVEIHYEGKFLVPTSVEAAGDMPTKWAAGLTNNAETINDRRKAKLPDEGTFQTKVAAPSSAKFSPMVDSNFVSQSGINAGNIIRRQYKNLAGAFNHYNDKLDLSFMTVDGVAAKRFKDQVNNSKDNWATAVAEKTLRLTGDKIRGMLASQSIYWATGDPLANQMTNGHELITGAPYDLTQGVLRQQFRAAMMGLIVQAGLVIVAADFLAAEITAQNTLLCALATLYNDAALDDCAEPDDPATGFWGFVFTDPELKLHVRIQETSI
ncbi:hypothetical protein ES707_22370 [subsurface metagenome]